MDDKKFYECLLAAYKGMYESLADGGSIYVFHADKEIVNFRVAFKMCIRDSLNPLLRKDLKLLEKLDQR